jgi:hypothetical protein
VQTPEVVRPRSTRQSSLHNVLKCFGHPGHWLRSFRWIIQFCTFRGMDCAQNRRSPGAAHCSETEKGICTSSRELSDTQIKSNHEQNGE